MIAQAWGHNPGSQVLGAPQLYLFEPHQTEQMGWKPDVLLDISDVWEQNWPLLKPWKASIICGNIIKTWQKTEEIIFAAIQADRPMAAKRAMPKRFNQYIHVPLTSYRMIQHQWHNRKENRHG